LNDFFTLGANAAFLPLAVAAGLGYAIILYRKNRIEDISTALHRLLFVLRFLSVTAIAMLLLNPMIKQIKKSVQRPVVVLAHDNSLSVVSNADSSFYLNPWSERWTEFSDALEEKYTVRNLLFASEVSDGQNPDYSGQYTDMSALAEDLSRRFSGRNLSAVVIAGDGIINRGTDPKWVYSLDAPVYSVLMGDTVNVKDRYIRKIRTNEITYLGNSFPLEVETGATLSEGESISVRVFRNGKRIASEQIDATSGNFFTTLNFLLDADSPGLQHYSVRISDGDGERNIHNNVKDFYIRILDSRKKVAVVASHISPDISALMQAMNSLNSYETELFDLNTDDSPDPELFDILVLYGMPDDEQFVLDIKESEKPVFFVLTGRDASAQFNQFENGILIDSKGEQNLVQPIVNEDFSSFSIPGGFSDLSADLSPLSVPFGEYNVAGGVSTLLFQKVGNVATDMPLLSVSKSLNTRYCMLLGDGFWKWRMINRKLYGNTNDFDQLISGLMQYLSITNEKQFLFVNGKEQYYENENVTFSAEVYDDNFVLNNEKELRLTLTAENGDTFPFSMLPAGSGYTLDAGRLLPGRYTYQAGVAHSDEYISVKGAFVVSEVVAELNKLVADHNLMRQLSANTEGLAYYPSELDELQNHLLNSETAKPVVSARVILRALVSDFRVFIFIILLLTIEWFLRRYAGSY
jgi:hypothetical protein